VVIGAGIIGLELGSVWRRLGAKVTVVEFLDRITPGMDAEMAKTFQRALTKQGMSSSWREGHRRQDVEDRRHPDRRAEAGGAAESLEADYVLVAIGRRHYTEGLGLESVGIVPDKRGFIAVDHFKDLGARRSGRWAMRSLAPCWPTRPRKTPSPVSS
jgi:dihydrolipoamide dehydrogenase